MSIERDLRSPVARSFEGAPRLLWHTASPDEVARYWRSDLELGLTREEAAARLTRVGGNRLQEAPATPLWRRLVAQLSDFTVLALIAAALISALLAYLSPLPGQSTLERFGDTIAILTIVVINAALGLGQEARAERALTALKKMTAPMARTLRSGRIVEVPAGDVVPGDLLLLEEGDRIPADARLIAAHDLEVEEAALTGEAIPVTKSISVAIDSEAPLAERKNMVYMGTRVARGRAQGIVANTAMYTELGQIAGMLASVEREETPLEADLERFGKRVVLGCIAISALVFAIGLWLGHESPRELFLVAVALAVAAIPEGLPAVTTIVLALGTQRMAHVHALVRRLPAVETLGCTQFICSDKTGTLTQNAMTVRSLFVGGAAFEVGGEGRSTQGAIASPAGVTVPELDLAIRAAAHAVGAKLVATGNRIEATGDPTDAALLVLAWKGGVHRHGDLVAEQPFSSERRMASVRVAEGSGERSYVRGAPEAILGHARAVRRNGQELPLTEELRAEWLSVAMDWSARAMRVIALAYRELPVGADPESELTLLALVGIVDPPRPEVETAVACAYAAGIRTVMITGDHPATARAIAEEIGLWQPGDQLLTGHELDGLDQQSLAERCDQVRVLARATAQHKLRMVEAMRSRGFVCAMTGDGVNDAPAVKAASIGIAMGTGTDVTKEAADLVLADDNYATILAAVAEGRAIYSNIRKFIFFLLSSNTGCVLVVLAAALLGWDAPLAPIQILWINLITNGLPALALGIEEREPQQMAVPPRPPGGAILGGRDYLDMVLVGVVMAVSALVAFRYSLLRGGLVEARTVCFAILALGPLAHAFNCRSQSSSVFRLGLFSNRALWGATIVGVALELMTLWVPALHPVFKTGPIRGNAGLWIAAMSILPLAFGELLKLLRWRRE